MIVEFKGIKLQHEVFFVYPLFYYYHDISQLSITLNFSNFLCTLHRQEYCDGNDNLMNTDNWSCWVLDHVLTHLLLNIFSKLLQPTWSKILKKKRKNWLLIIIILIKKKIFAQKTQMFKELFGRFVLYL